MPNRHRAHLGAALALATAFVSSSAHAQEAAASPPAPALVEPPKKDLRYGATLGVLSVSRPISLALAGRYEAFGVNVEGSLLFPISYAKATVSGWGVGAEGRWFP